MSLNPRQLEAVEHGEGPLLLLAGAGSGKTRVLVHRIGRLLEEGVAGPENILAVTFTNKAAKELVARCERLVGPAASELWVGTFHGICARILRRHASRIGYPSGFSIFDTDDQLRLLKELLVEANLDPATVRPAAIRTELDRAKNEARSPEEMEAAATDELAMRAAALYGKYQERLLRAGAMDFGDLILNVLKMFRECPDILARYQDRFRYVMVDEYQDTNRAQYLLVQSLASGSGNLCVVGDDDQSIYAWRGADIRNILEFERDFPGAHVVRLEQNYRSTRNIIDAAAAVIDHNDGRRDKRMWTDNAAGAPIRVVTAADDRDEARWIVDELIALGDRRSEAAVFYRTNAQSRALEEVLVRSGIRYQIVGAVRFYERREIKDLIAYLRFAANPNDDISLDRIINVPGRGIGKVTWERVRAMATQAGLSVWQALQDDGLLASSVGGAARGRLLGFRETASRWMGTEVKTGSEVGTVADLLKTIMDDTGFVTWLEGRVDDKPAERIENVNELLGAAQRFDFETDMRQLGDEDERPTPLALFLEQLALSADIDSYEDGGKTVTLMTVHNSKGLEYQEVFLAGMEEGVFPHSRSLGEDERGIEEERRLCYVGMTRAERRLTMTRARRRMVFGSTQYNLASRFLDETPGELTEILKTPLARNERSSYTEGGYAGGSSRSSSGGGSSSWDFDQRSPEEFAKPAKKKEESYAPAGRFKPGMRVMHPMFGGGTVKKSEGNGESEKVTVLFQRAGMKKLVARFANLEIVS